MKALVFLVLLGAAMESFATPEKITSLSEESVKEEVDFETYCRPAADRGPCKGYFPSWWYNVATRQCEEFVYTGCAGNNNNYVTKEDCERTCLRESDTPEESITENLMYKKLEEMLQCRLEPSERFCGAHLYRYYYDWRSGACKLFIYSGCFEDANNFLTLEDCEAKCAGVGGPVNANADTRLVRVPVFLSHKSVDLPEAFDVPFWPLSTPQECTNPADSGPCEAYMERFFYNTLTKSCEQFVYGGCGGNANNFLTFSQCDKKCKKFRAVLPRA